MHWQLAGAVSEPDREMPAASLVGMEGAALPPQPASKLSCVHPLTSCTTFVLLSTSVLSFPTATRACALTPLTGREIPGDAGGVVPVYRRPHGAASCSSGGSVAEIVVDGASCHIGVSNSIPVLVPPLLDSRSFGSCRSVIGAFEVERKQAEARSPGRSASQSPSSCSAGGLGEAVDRDA